MDSAEDWQCDKSLVECLGHLMNSEICTDVTFFLGEEQEVVHAHKTILISRSPVFYAMLEGPLAEKGEITIPDYSKATFQIFLRYLYTDHACLDAENVVSVLSVARKYYVNQLMKKCMDFFNRLLIQEHVDLLKLLEQTHLYTEGELKQTCLNSITIDPLKFLKSESFTSLCSSCVRSITEKDELHVQKEEQVYEAVLRWSNEECERQRLEVTDENMSKVLGDILNTVRFPIMEAQYFAGEVCTRDIISADDMKNVYRQMYNKGTVTETRFQCKPRNTSIKQVVNFERILCHLSTTTVKNGGKKNFERLTFGTSQDVNFHGICLSNIPVRSQKLVSKRFIICDGNGDTMYDYESKFSLSPDDTVVDVVFDKAISLFGFTKYKMLTTFKSPMTHSPEITSEVRARSAVITFFKQYASDCEVDPDNLSVIQISGILLSGH